MGRKGSLRVRLLLLCLCLSVGLPSVQASERPLKVTFILSPPLIVGTPDEYVFSGIMIDAVTSLANTCGLKAVFVESPSWSRAQIAAQEGVADALMPTNWSEHRLAHFHFPEEAIYDSEMRVMTLKGYGYESYDGLAMLRGKRVGKLDNALIAPDVDRFLAGPAVILSERPTVLALFENLVRRRLDFVIGDVLSGIHYTSEAGLWDKVQVLEPAIGAIPQYLALSRKSPLFREAGGPDILQCLLETPQKASDDSRSTRLYEKNNK